MGRAAGRFLLPALVLLSFAALACGSSATPEPTPTATPAPTAPPTPTATPAPTPDLESIVRRVLAEQLGGAPPPTAAPAPPAVDTGAIVEEVTERVLAAMAEASTPTPGPTPEPTPTPEPPPTPAPTPTVAELTRLSQKSVARISGPSEGQAWTGVVVEVEPDDGRVFALTVASVAEAGELTVRSVGARYEAEVEGVDERLGLALVAWGPDDAAVPVVFGDALTLEVGADVVALDYQRDPDAGLAVSRGYISSTFFQPEFGRWLLVSDLRALSHGTGGPLLTRDGRLVGINVSDAGAAAPGFSPAVSEVTITQWLGELRPAN